MPLAHTGFANSCKNSHLGLDRGIDAADISDKRVRNLEITIETMLFSKACSYAIRASVLVAAKDPDGRREFIPIRELADEVGVSFHFLTKILRKLTEANIMESFRGPNGGVGLIRPARQVSVIDIVAAIDGMGLFEGCALGLPQCSEKNPCPLHAAWKKRREDLKSMLTRTSLAELAGGRTISARRK